ncbi:hypothetical protein MferCBS31731_002430 [Microsporum ferrugineum]
MPLEPPFPPLYKQSAVKTPEDGTDDGKKTQAGPSSGQLRIKLDPIGTLPTIARVKEPYTSRESGHGNHAVYLVEDEGIDRFVEGDLSVQRLNDIHGLLWMAGRPLNARKLQRYKMIGFDFLPTEQADLHLIHFSNKIYLKTLPDYILDYDFWEKYLCKNEELHKLACGFLLSWVWLICSPIDLQLAKDAHLLSPQITWAWWKQFVRDFNKHVDFNALDKVNKRYHFGELRLGRINTIFRIRFFHSHFIRGYLYSYNRYQVFFERNFGWLIGAFVYISVVLSAMQVGTAIPPLNNNQAFQKASYGVVVMSIVAVAACLAFVVILFSWIYLYNMVAAIWHSRSERQKRKKLAVELAEKAEFADRTS